MKLYIMRLPTSDFGSDEFWRAFNARPSPTFEFICEEGMVLNETERQKMEATPDFASSRITFTPYPENED